MWWDVAFLAFVLIPAVFALVWLVLPLRRARGLVAAALGLAVSIAILSACGGGTPTGTSGSPGTAAGTGGFQAYLNCLKQNGVTITLP